MGDVEWSTAMASWNIPNGTVYRHSAQDLSFILLQGYPSTTIVLFGSDEQAGTRAGMWGVNNNLDGGSRIDRTTAQYCGGCTVDVAEKSRIICVTLSVYSRCEPWHFSSSLMSFRVLHKHNASLVVLIFAHCLLFLVFEWWNHILLPGFGFSNIDISHQNGFQYAHTLCFLCICFPPNDCIVLVRAVWLRGREFLRQYFGELSAFPFSTHATTWQTGKCTTPLGLHQTEDWRELE